MAPIKSIFLSVVCLSNFVQDNSIQNFGSPMITRNLTVFKLLGFQLKFIFLFSTHCHMMKWRGWDQFRSDNGFISMFAKEGPTVFLQIEARDRDNGPWIDSESRKIADYLWRRVNCQFWKITNKFKCPKLPSACRDSFGFIFGPAECLDWIDSLTNWFAADKTWHTLQVLTYHFLYPSTKWNITAMQLVFLDHPM